MEENKLIKNIAKTLERDEDEITELVSTMSYKDLVLIADAIRKSDNSKVLSILHGYGL